MFTHEWLVVIFCWHCFLILTIHSFSVSIMPRQFYIRNYQNVAWEPLVVPGNVQMIYHRVPFGCQAQLAASWLTRAELAHCCSPQFPMFIVTQFLSKNGSLVENWLIKVINTYFFEKVVQNWISRKSFKMERVGRYTTMLLSCCYTVIAKNKKKPNFAHWKIFLSLYDPHIVQMFI